VSMVGATPKPRLVKLKITQVGQESFTAEGPRYDATHYLVKVDLGALRACWRRWRARTRRTTTCGLWVERYRLCQGGNATLPGRAGVADRNGEPGLATRGGKKH